MTDFFRIDDGSREYGRFPWVHSWRTAYPGEWRCPACDAWMPPEYGGRADAEVEDLLGFAATDWPDLFGNGGGGPKFICTAATACTSGRAT